MNTLTSYKCFGQPLELKYDTPYVEGPQRRGGNVTSAEYTGYRRSHRLQTEITVNTIMTSCGEFAKLV